MAKAYANVIIDISHEKVDKTFQYKIPKALEDQIGAGVQVRIPFGMGNHVRKGYVVEVTDQAEYDPLKMKAVSYTHLDVYKRQVCSWGFLAWWALYSLCCCLWGHAFICPTRAIQLRF